jgi:hypothetical protein
MYLIAYYGVCYSFLHGTEIKEHERINKYYFASGLVFRRSKSSVSHPFPFLQAQLSNEQLVSVSKRLFI